MTTRIRMHSPPKEDRMKDVPNNTLILLIAILVCVTILVSIYLVHVHV